MTVPVSQLTVRDMIEETRRHCSGTIHFEYNALAAGLAATDPTLTLSGPMGAMAHGTFIAIEDEILYVMAVSQATCTVIRGMQGTVPTPHAAGTLVELSPRFSTFSIRRALMEEINSWPHVLFVPRNLVIKLAGPFAGGGLLNGSNSQMAYTAAYDLSPLTDRQVLHILGVTHEPWGRQYRNSWPDFSWIELRRQQPLDLFPSGLVLVIKETIVASVRANVQYASPFNLDNFEDYTTCVGDIGLQPSMFDIAPLGAAADLLAPKEIGRTQSESWSQERDATQVPPDMIGRVAGRLQAQCDKRISEEDERLSSRYPKRWS